MYTYMYIIMYIYLYFIIIMCGNRKLKMQQGGIVSSVSVDFYCFTSISIVFFTVLQAFFCLLMFYKQFFVFFTVLQAFF